MANNIGIIEATLAQISDKTFRLNDPAAVGSSIATEMPQATRSSVYQPMVVRVVNHPDDKYVQDDPIYGTAESMALFLSTALGQPWVRTGQQLTYLRHPVAGVAIAPITDTEPYSVIYVNYDYEQDFQ